MRNLNQTSNLDDGGDGKIYVLGIDGQLLRTESCSSGCYIQIEGSYEIYAVQGSFEIVPTGDSGLAFEGTGIGKSFFEFLARETDVEWGLSLKSGGIEGEPGYIKTSYLQNSVDNPCREGYDTMYHNHGNGEYANAQEGRDAIRDFCAYPSRVDIENMSGAYRWGYTSFYIFNELEKKISRAYREYTNDSTTMEERARQLGYTPDDGYGW